MFCPKCGKKIEDRAVFCPYCGVKQDSDINKENAPVEDVTNIDEQIGPNPQRSNSGRAPLSNRAKLLIVIAAIVVVAIIVILIVVSNSSVTSTENAKETAETSSESAEVFESATESSKTTPTPAETQQTTESETNTAIVKTTVDGYITSMDELPIEFFEQCENEGKNVVLENQDSLCLDYLKSEYVKVDSTDKIKCVSWYFATRDEPKGGGATYLSQTAKNALCFLYEFKGISRLSEKSSTGWCSVWFDDIMGNNGILEYTKIEISTSGSTDLSPAKSALKNYITTFDFTIIGDPLKYPNYS